MLTRRFFLAASAGSLACAGLPLPAAAVMSSQAPLKPAVDQRLEAKCDVLQSGQRIAQMNLVAVEQPFMAETRVAQYVFNFESTQAVFLPEATYEVCHPTLGKLDLLLQPCGNFKSGQHDGIQYRACIAMLRKI